MESKTVEKMVAIREATESERFGHLERLKLKRERKRGRNQKWCCRERKC